MDEGRGGAWTEGSKSEARSRQAGPAGGTRSAPGHSREAVGDRRAGPGPQGHATRTGWAHHSLPPNAVLSALPGTHAGSALLPEGTEGLQARVPGAQWPAGRDGKPHTRHLAEASGSTSPAAEHPPAGTPGSAPHSIGRLTQTPGRAHGGEHPRPKKTNVRQSAVTGRRCVTPE